MGDVRDCAGGHRPDSMIKALEDVAIEVSYVARVLKAKYLAPAIDKRLITARHTTEDSGGVPRHTSVFGDCGAPFDFSVRADCAHKRPRLLFADIMQRPE